jgi:hypothetical protein
MVGAVSSQKYKKDLLDKAITLANFIRQSTWQREKERMKKEDPSPS